MLSLAVRRPSVFNLAAQGLLACFERGVEFHHQQAACGRPRSSLTKRSTPGVAGTGVASVSRPQPQAMSQAPDQLVYG